MSSTSPVNHWHGVNLFVCMHVYSLDSWEWCATFARRPLKPSVDSCSSTLRNSSLSSTVCLFHHLNTISTTVLLGPAIYWNPPQKWHNSTTSKPTLKLKSKSVASVKSMLNVEKDFKFHRWFWCIARPSSAGKWSSLASQLLNSAMLQSIANTLSSLRLDFIGFCLKKDVLNHFLNTTTNATN